MHLLITAYTAADVPTTTPRIPIMLTIRFTPTGPGTSVFNQIRSKISGTFKRVTLLGFMSALSVFSLHTTASPQPELTDANIAAIVVGANKIDISAAEVALKRSSNKKVLQFARTMITDHKAVLSSAVDLAGKLKLTPIDNELVASLAKQSRNHERELQTLSGESFDRAYINHEVDYHRAVIDVIESQLIPGAENEELKSLLISVLPAFRVHLAHCEQIQRELL